MMNVMNLVKENKKWLDEHNISDKQFYYWQKKLRSELSYEVAKVNNVVHNERIEFSPIDVVDSKINHDDTALIHIGAATIELSANISNELFDVYILMRNLRILMAEHLWYHYDIFSNIN